jgi:cell fate regulator YaaT (PSP1 superfamily)
MEQIVGVRFKPVGKIYYFSSGGLSLTLDDSVIVETSRGMEFGTVVLFPGPEDLQKEGNEGPFKPIIRKATQRDWVQLDRNREREKQAAQICLKKIKKLHCPMKLLRVEYTFDRSKIVFFFTAEGRVDFRELVKELAAVFHTRIEMRQVGVRDEAKQLSGIGPCGRTLCCATFLSEFAPVSIKMAKTQGLSLNPSKISGICGRLMCCLRYENGMYKKGELGCCRTSRHKEEETGEEPFVGMRVTVNGENGQVIYVNRQKHMVRVQINEETRMVPWKDITKTANE